MAIFHLSTNAISRGKGKSVVGACAYRTGTKMVCERTGLTHDYTKKKGIMHTAGFVLNKRGDIIEHDQHQKLWNGAEKAEIRKDARTGREIIINLPHELPDDYRQKLARDFTKHIVNKFKVGATLAIHAPDRSGDSRNYHAHILFTVRECEYDNTTQSFNYHNKTSLELSNTKLKALGLERTQEQIKDIRKDWEIMCNQMLERVGLRQRIDCRSHADRGLEQLPSIKMGWRATDMERKGIATHKGNINRAIQEYNEMLDAEVVDWFEHRVEKQADDIEVTVPYSVTVYEVQDFFGKRSYASKFVTGHHDKVDKYKMSKGEIKVLVNQGNVISFADWDGDWYKTDLFRLVNNQNDIKQHIDEYISNMHIYSNSRQEQAPAPDPASAHEPAPAPAPAPRKQEKDINNDFSFF